jgi:hypothetical protein
MDQTLKGFGGWRTLFRVERPSCLIPGVLASSNPGLELANAFGVFIRIQTGEYHYSFFFTGRAAHDTLNCEYGKRSSHGHEGAATAGESQSKASPD